MQKLWLKDFEHYIAASTRQAAEALLQSRAVKRLHEVERHFWVATVLEQERPLEAEVIITPNKIKAFACECWEESRRSMCPHIAATLFKIRKYLAKKAQERREEARAAAQAQAKRLNLDDLLADTPPGELVAFVRSYAEQDTTFALALKAHFIGKIAEESTEHFRALLKTALPEQIKGRALRPAEARRARLVLDRLVEQAVTTHAATSFRLSAAILQYLAERTALAEAPQREWLLGYCRQALRLLIHNDRLSPEQREQARHLLLALFTHGAYPAELATDTLHFLALAARDDAFYGHIYQQFEKADYPVPTPILLLLGAALAERRQYALLQRILQAHFAQAPTVVMEVLQMLARLPYAAALLPTGIALLEAEILSSRRQLELENLLVETAEKAGQTEALAQLLRRRFCRQGDISTLTRLRQAGGANWPQERERLVADLRNQQAWDKLALLLAQESEPETLAALLQECADLSLVQQYEHLFLPQQAEFICNMYLSALGHHLNTHFGRQAAEYARDHLATLVGKGHAPLASQIAQSLVERFPERPYLPEKLAEAFPLAHRPTFALHPSA